MIKNILISFFLTIILFLSVNARIRHVPSEYQTIQEGINDCSGGDTLLVDPGEYFENINFNGQYLVLASRFILTGNVAYIDSTIINGDSSGSVVIFETGEDSRAVLTGFTITGGYSENGGGIFCEDSAPIIAYNIIKENVTWYPYWPCGQGAGIYCESSDATIINNLIIDNSAIGNVGGRGGGLICINSNPDIINNTFSRNLASWRGGAIYCDSSSPNITNCILWGNTADEGAEFYIEVGTPLVTFCDIYSGWEGIGNINANPEFRDRENGDFHLMSTAYGFPYNSPCIDAGAPYIRDFVLDSLWGLGTFISDMGAYGGGDFELAGINDEILELPNGLLALGNYPNPFNGRTVISYQLSKGTFVNIEIYDILGRRVETLLNSYRQAGSYEISWGGAGKVSGIYFYLIKTPELIEMRKMQLLK